MIMMWEILFLKCSHDNDITGMLQVWDTPTNKI
jgi:hypothetical protein